MSSRIYLDYAATTPLDASVREAMMPFFNESFGNPSSVYKEGQETRRAIDAAREEVADILAIAPRGVVFTPTATASDNLAVLGVVGMALKKSSKSTPHVVISGIEHKAVQRPVEYLAKQKMIEVTMVNSKTNGIIAVEDVVSAIRPETVFLSVMLANSEIGTIQPVRDIARAVREKNNTVIIHSDVVQAASWMDVRPEKLGVDLVSLSGHKFYGPRGVGVLGMREDIDLESLVYGGGQERGFFSGTENTASIVGFARAFSIAREGRDVNVERVSLLRDKLLNSILREVPWAYLTGDKENRLPNNIHLTLDGVEAESAVIALDREGISASTGSACSSGAAEPSTVLRSIGYSKEKARCGLRFSLGLITTEKEIERASKTISGTLLKLK